MASSWFQRLLLPGLVFQSLVIAGGYGTGREIAEFFLSIGPKGGLAAILVAALIWSLVCAASFEFARLFGTYDYQSFFRRLIGPGALAFEVSYFLLMAIILAVVAASAGSIGEVTFGVPFLVGVGAMTGAIALLVFLGTDLIERFFSIWSFVLYGVYALLVLGAFRSFGGDIASGFSSSSVGSGWVLQGVRYAGYNLALIPAMLFVVRHARTRSDAVGAGLLAGPIAMAPALLFFIAMVGQYPGIEAVAVPSDQLLNALGSRGFQIAFQVVLLGTLIETGAGMIHGVNERLATALRSKGHELPRSSRVGLAVVWLFAGAAIAQFGLIALIARGYGTVTWIFIAVYVVPILTIGIVRIARAEPRAAPPLTG